MTEKEQICAFANDLDNLVERYASEFNLTYSSVIGVLFSKATILTMEAQGIYNEDDN